MTNQKTQNDMINSVSIGVATEMMHDVIYDAFQRNKVPGNCCLVGAPGTAKSASVWGLAVELEQELNKECEVIDLRLGGMEAADVQGIPYVSKEGIRNGKFISSDQSQMFFSTPAWWPNDESKNYILFLDELMNTPMHVQHAAYRLILDRTCQNGSKLPDNVAIIAAGNRKEDKTGAKPLLPAAANRFALHLIIDQDAAADEFTNYAMNAGWDRTIVGFLSYKRDAIYQAPNDTEAAFPTQRSWEFADQHVRNPRIASSEHKLRIAVAGAVGNAQATDYMGFREHFGKLPEWKAIRSGELRYDVPTNDTGLQFAVSASLASEILDCLKMEDINKSKNEVSNLCEVFDQIPAEMKVVTFKMMKSSTEFTTQFLKYPELTAIFKQISAKMRR